MPRTRSTLQAAAAAAVVGFTAVGIAAAGPAAPAPRGAMVVTSTRDSTLHNELWSLDLRTGRRVNLSRNPAGDREPAVSADGGSVAFVSDRGGAEALYVARPDGGGLRRIAGPYPEPAGRQVQLHDPSWSPDGRRLVFLVSSVGQGSRTVEARVVARAGGPARRIAAGGIELARWSPDGRRLGVTTIGLEGFRTNVYDLRGRRLWRVVGRLADWSANGDLALVFAPLDSLAVVSRAGRVRWRTTGNQAVWSPDGRFLAVVEQGSLRVLDERGRVRLRPVAFVGDVTVGSWLPDGRGLIVSGEDGRIVRVGLDGRTAALARGDLLEVAEDGAVAFVTPTAVVVRRGSAARAYRMSWQVGLCRVGFPERLAWAGRDRLVFAVGSRGQAPGDLWIVGAGSPRRLPGGKNSWRGMPAWSPDGEKIAYEHGTALTHGGGCSGPHTPHLRVADASGGGVRLLTRPGTAVDTWDTDPRWSPDGRHVAFARAHIDDADAFGIFVVDAVTRVERRLTNGPGSLPTWTADGLSIVYEQDGAVRRVQVADGSVVTLAPGALPDAAPRSSSIAFLRGGALWSVRADGTGARRLGAVLRRARPPGLEADPPRWSPAADRIAVTDAQGVLVFDLDGGTARIPAPGAAGPAWSPDGRTISFSAPVGRYSRGVFSSAYAERTELFTAPAAGGRPTRLTSDLANVLGAAAWRP